MADNQMIQIVIAETRRCIDNEQFDAARRKLDWLAKALTPPVADAVHQERPQPFALRAVADYFGWGSRLSDEGIFNFIVERENLLRVAQGLLETHKSNAPDAALALVERIKALREPTPASPWQHKAIELANSYLQEKHHFYHNNSGNDEAERRVLDFARWLDSKL